MKKTDLINKKIIEALNPCEDRFNNYLQHYKSFSGTLQNFLSLDNITYSDKIWVVTRLFTKEQNAAWSIKCALSVLPNFESMYPNDLRPRQALEAAEAYLNNPCEEIKLAARSAAELSGDSIYSRSTIGSSAWKVEWAAYSAAVLSSRSSTWSASDIAFSAESSVFSTVDSAAELEAKKEQEELNLIFMVEVLEGI